MSTEFDKNSYSRSEQPHDPELSRDQVRHHEELIQMLNREELGVHTDPIRALERLKAALAKFL